MKRQIIIGVLVGAVFMALAFLGISLSDFASSLASIHLSWLVLFSLMLMLQVLLQSVRQQVLLQDAIADMTLRDSTVIMSISLFSIQTFPARLGELIRPWLLQRMVGLPLGQGMGMLALERALDLVALLIALVLMLLWAVPPSAELVVAGQHIDIIGWGWSTAQIVVPMVAGAVVLLAATGEVLIDALAPTVLRLAGPRIQPVVSFARSFAQAFRTLHKPIRLVTILVLTAVIWAEVAAMYLVLAHAFGLQQWLGYPESVGVMTITALGALLPAPPGMAGVQEAFGRGALALFGVRGGGLDALALSYAVVAHWWQFVLVAVMAFWSASRQGLRWREMLSSSKEAVLSAETTDHR